MAHYIPPNVYDIYTAHLPDGDLGLEEVAAEHIHLPM